MPIGLTTAVIGAGALSAGAGIYAANSASSASNKATNAVVSQQDKALQASTAAYNDIKNDVVPYQKAGTDALDRISTPDAVNANFQASPDYNFRLNAGENAVTTNKAVNGLLKSGGALKAVNNYAQNTASNEFTNWWAKQQGLVNTGLTAEQIASGAASGISGANQNTANQSSAAIAQNGANQGNAALAIGNSVSSGIGGITDILTKYSNTGSSYAPAANWAGADALPGVA